MHQKSKASNKQDRCTNSHLPCVNRAHCGVVGASVLDICDGVIGA